MFGGGNSNIQNLQNETFTVTEEDDVVSVNTQLYRVSGYCKLNGVNVSDDARITFFDKNSSSTSAANDVEDGKYSVYVSTGEYKVTISGSVGILASEEITVTDASVEKNFDIEAGKLTGKLTWKMVVPLPILIRICVRLFCKGKSHIIQAVCEYRTGWFF